MNICKICYKPFRWVNCDGWCYVCYLRGIK
jgi:hypothetical protein